jgi:peptide/nickel transport system substrate-binding protein
LLGAIGLGLVVGLAGPASAQKAKDTLRTAFQSPIETIDLYLEPGPENALLTRSIFDGLVFFDERHGDFKPLLAKAWRHPSPLVYEFDLKSGIKWHDGQAFDADDVVYTVNWLIDPKSKYRNPTDFNWIKNIEKLASDKVRITAKRPFAPALVRAAYSLLIYPEHVHAKLADKADFGRAPVGTGHYRLTQVDKNKGILAERFDAFAHGGDYKVKSNIGHWAIMPVPDLATQQAQMLVGNIDYARGIDREQAKEVAQQIKGGITGVYGLNYTYALFDAKGRSGVEALKDARVRKAIVMGINRKELMALAGADASGPLLGGLCFKSQQGCGYTAEMPVYDPAAAKKLLAEAGYADGFDLEVTTYAGTTSEFGKAVAGQLRQIGIRTSVDIRTLATARKKINDGKIQLLVGGWSQGGLPDPQGTVRLFASPPSDTDDYFGDEVLAKLGSEVNAILDDKERRAQVARLFDRMTERTYVVPLVQTPQTFVHTAEVAINPSSFNPYGADMQDFRWK